MPCLENKLRTVSLGCAPFAIQSSAFSSSIFTATGSATGLYVPICSIERPSRGERESATTIRLNGFLFAPILLRRILTAISFTPPLLFYTLMILTWFVLSVKYFYMTIYINGNGKPFPFLPFCIFVICFIIFFISLNCFNKRFTWDTFVPDPFAIRFFRLALIMEGSCLSAFVID